MHISCISFGKSLQRKSLMIVTAQDNLCRKYLIKQSLGCSSVRYRASYLATLVILLSLN